MLGGNTNSLATSFVLTNNGRIVSLNLEGYGCLICTKSVRINDINIYISNSLIGKNAISIYGMNSLEMNSVTIGGENELKDISDSLIKVCGGATVSFTTVAIKNIRLIGNDKYGAVMMIDFISYNINEDNWKYTVITRVPVIDLTVRAYGINAYGDYYYLILRNDQITGSKPSEIKSNMKSKITIIDGIDKENKIFYSLDEGNTQKDLNKLNRLLYINTANPSDECGRLSLDPCELSLAVSIGEGIPEDSSVIIYVAVDNAVVRGDISFDNNNIANGYTLTKEGVED